MMRLRKPSSPPGHRDERRFGLIRNGDIRTEILRVDLQPKVEFVEHLRGLGVSLLV